MVTTDDVLANLVIANMKESDSKHVIYYKNLEIDTDQQYGKTNSEIAREIIDQIYEAEEIDYPRLTKGEIDLIMNRIEGLKSCIMTNRRHVNETAETMGEKSLLLEKLSYNLETKVDGIIMELEEMFERPSDEE